MTTGIKKLQRIQLGKETVAGTAVVATTRWRGPGAMLDDQRVIEQIDELIGILNAADRDAVVQLLGMWNIAETPCTPEQLPYMLAMGMGGPVTGAADGVGTGKIYQTTIPTTAKPTLVPYTLEGGDDHEVERLEYAVCKQIKISGAMGQTARMSGQVIGRQVQRFASGFTAISVPAVSELPVQQGKVYLDAIGGTYGTTQVATTIIQFDVTIDILMVPTFTMDGNLYFSYPSYTDHKITGQITFLHDTASAGNTGAKADFRARTPKLLRIDLIGDTTATPGTLYSTKKAIIDLPTRYLNPGPLADNSGNDIVVMKFYSKYDLTAGNGGKIIVVNELASLT